MTLEQFYKEGISLSAIEGIATYACDLDDLIKSLEESSYRLSQNAYGLDANAPARYKLDYNSGVLVVCVCPKTIKNCNIGIVLYKDFGYINSRQIFCNAYIYSEHRNEAEAQFVIEYYKDRNLSKKYIWIEDERMFLQFARLLRYDNSLV